MQCHILSIQILYSFLGINYDIFMQNITLSALFNTGHNYYPRLCKAYARYKVTKDVYDFEKYMSFNVHLKGHTSWLALSWRP